MLSKYVLHEKIGEGGYSSVYKCTDQIGIRYAIKKLPKLNNRRARVQQEIEIMKRMQKSPKVVQLVDAGEDQEAYYIVQEWCRGGDVKDYVQNAGGYVENTVASVVRGVLRGLIHLHSEGIIHRDIKAGNILLGDRSVDADVKIGDLGTAILTDFEEVEVCDLVGTVWFMSPENLRHIYHPNSDIWSLGVLTYQLLSGKMPFNDAEAPLQPEIAKIWREILHKDPSMKGRRWSEISKDAQDFVRQCLIKDYKGRPNALELLSHPWLTRTDCNDRFYGTPLSCDPFVYENATAMNAKTCKITNDLDWA